MPRPAVGADGVEASPPKPAVRTASYMPPWVHMAAGATAGIATSIVTAPLDVLRTRLQSDFYRLPSRPTLAAEYAGATLRHLLIAPFHHTAETFGILGSIKAKEGWRGLFRGLGPSLAAVVPATAVKFYVYGNCKRLGASILGRGEGDSFVHAQAAILAGVATATATNPIWLVKTRLQLDKSQVAGGATRQYRGSLDCVRKVLRQEGLPGLYRGLTASYLGTVETAFHLILYERFKVLFHKSLRPENWDNPMLNELATWASTTGAAGTAKLAAVLVTYPHEVVRTRLRQAPTVGGRPRYTGLVQCFTSVWALEGWCGLYGGLTPHLVRSIPSAAITLGVYEFVLRLVRG
ncbi:mitochondrial carrier domain-containing protein [Thermothelomyces heterothallicus CBS 202.75]|uniref:mitochondrial carrier domain-containing protein n=1 Tax=Thermothelomyces heterothallicus CBS 202.75 TaxID=1149848 RepID=UPI0037428DCC